jgi:hypothetical protein
VRGVKQRNHIVSSLKPTITVDGNLSDWIASERIDYGDAPGYNIYAQAQGDYFYWALSGPLAIGPNTTAWFNTDLNTASGYLIWGWAGGAEYNLNIKSDGTAALYSGAAGQTLVLDNIQLAYSSNHQSVEFAIPKAALGNPAAIDTYYDINDSVFLPAQYATGPYVAYNNSVTRTDPTHRIGIVYSATTAANYFSATAYSDLIMAAQSQAMQAGIPFDLLTEADLKDLAKLVNYDALVFPSFSHLQASDVAPITDTLVQATRQFGIGLITSGNFMTNDPTGAPLPGDPYARMKLLFDAMRVTGGTGDLTIKSSDANHTVFTTMDSGALIRSYTAAGWDTFASVSGTGQTIATETVGGQTYTAALATQTGGRNVLFSTPAVMADSNLLWQAIDYVANAPGISVGLNLTRFEGIVASRTDMDEAMERDEIRPPGGEPGMYDKLIPILQQWKQQFDFVGSYYVDIGNDPANGQMTDWSVSAPYYAEILALGNELGTHSYTHPPDTNFITPEQIQFEFQQSKLVLQQQMSAYLGHPFSIEGAAVPGMPEGLPTSEQIIQYFNYLTGGAVFVGAGYPGAFGFLTPDLTNAVYLAPNTSFDFTLIDWQQHTAAEAETLWAQEWNALVANAHTPIVLWPWHDYGVTEWPLFGVAISPYTLEMYTDYIQRAYQSGAEFVTEADLASRIQSFVHSGVTSTVNGNVISVTVASAHAGDFALDVSGTGSQVIENVANWYAYDSDSLFLPESGGNFTITLGATADDVTHITALPMRGDLLSVTGDGLNLAFSMFGEGEVVIDLGQHGNNTPVVTGASIVSLTGDLLTLTLTGLGEHDVSLSMTSTPPPSEVVTTVAFSADTGSSASDFVTSTAAQTISGTLSAALGTGDVVRVSLDNGTTWRTATAAAGATTFSLAGITLTGSNTLIARVENAGGTSSAAFSRPYVLDQVAPATPAGPDLAAASDNGASNTDNITSVTTPTFTGTADAGSRVTLFDGATAIGTGTATAGAWTITTSALTTGSHSITAKAADLAGNLSAASAALAVTISGSVAPPSAPDLVATSDNGAFNTDNITNVTRPTFTGTAAAGSTVTLYDGTIAVGTGIATATGSWTVTTASSLANGAHSVTAKAADSAGNASAASAALSITVDATAPAIPSAADLMATSDSGRSTTDNITNIVTPSFTGTAEAGSTVTLFDGTTAVGTGVATGGKWTIAASTLANGTHSITTKATDVAGNVSAASSKLSVTIDTLAPSAPAFTAITASGSGLTLTGTGDASTTVAILNGTTQLGTTTVGTGGTWSLSFSTTSSVRTLTAVGSDTAGNKSPTPSGSVLVGTSSANMLTSTANNELLYGGGGADTFTFAALFGRDVIADFAVSGTRHDVINFHGNSVLKDFANVMSHATQVGSGVVISQDSSNVLTLSNVTRSSLTASDFTFV